MNLGFIHPQDVDQVESIRPFLTEHLAEQAGISRIILNQKNLERFSFHDRVSRDNLTIDNQSVGALHGSKEPIGSHRLSTHAGCQIDSREN
jgi:hypothetical protein